MLRLDRTWMAALIAAAGIVFGSGLSGAPAAPPEAQPAADRARVRLITLDPGHYHAALVQKNMYEQVDPVVHIYAPAGADLDEHLRRIELFNTRPDRPTRWESRVHTGPDFFADMLREKPGNVVVLAGNNMRKTGYILGCIKAGLNVLADKPMVINPAKYPMLLEAFKIAEEKGVLLYDIMTERHEITSILQRELSMIPEVFGQLRPGTPEEPAVTKESVHHFSKLVAGKPLKRPAWFFDVEQEGEGIVDVATHLVDLVQWECFPEQVLEPSDVRILSARRWATPVTPAQFEKVTGYDHYPDYLSKDVRDGVLQVFGNGEIIYTLRGVVAKVSVIWNFEAPPGAADTHYSIMRGTKADLVIEQGQRQNYKPVLYVHKRSQESDEAFEKTLLVAIEKLSAKHNGLRIKKCETGWEVVIPDALKADHEQHFCDVTDTYLAYLAQGTLPRWEVAAMIVKYHTLMEAYKASR